MPKSLPFDFEMLYYSYQEINDFLLNQHPMIYQKSNLYNCTHVNQGRVTKHIKNGAHKLIRKNKLVSYGGNHYTCTYKSTECSVDILAKKCSCFRFLDKAVCKHLIAACLKDDVELKGLRKKTKILSTVRKKYLKKNDSSDEDSIIAEEDNCNEGSGTFINQVNVKKKQSCKDITNKTAKSSSNLDSEKAKRKPGRPKKISRALSLDNSPSKNTEKNDATLKKILYNRNRNDDI
ncbi:unnamed protein product [Brachionus calyciflorus]|uniref:SWIM-type domain-containing protein n=1 Tax=Brachionus calyciflorus TaxID=104777 RepID=A0A813SRJ7_9BILA|nr:unnamed protein product [Brachionus calyciflorus]